MKRVRNKDFLAVGLTLLTGFSTLGASAQSEGFLLVGEEVFQADVVSVSSGESLSVQASARIVRIVLDGIDAPEIEQPFGEAARDFLAESISGKRVTVHLEASDPTDPETRIARVFLGDRDITLEMLRAGLAWFCPRYTEASDLAAAEAEARAAKRGLWGHEEPIPPWEYRGANRCFEGQFVEPDGQA